MAKANIKKYGDAKYDLITREVEANHPDLTGQIANMCKYVEKWSGGEAAQFLHELWSFQGGLKFTRTVDGTSWGLLASLPLQEAPEYVTGLAKAMMSSPEKYCKMGPSRLFVSSDFSELKRTAERAAVVRAASSFRAAAAYLDKPKTSKTHRAQLLGDFQVRTAMTLHSKKCPTRKGV
eukprot:9498326-Pyramimonas_sp.AAC.1